MAWPLASQYASMLQNPKVAFKNQELRKAKIKSDPNNQPIGMSGAFAVVYQADLPNGQSTAVRVFTSDKGSERKERYNEISSYLKSRSSLKSLVSFEYNENSVRATDGKWYPLVTMDWIDGDILQEWVRKKCEAGDGRGLRTGADRWIELVTELNDADIAHGDLQQANVLVTPSDELKLVDYDCMCVPSLVGRRNLEIGVDPYQHPDRDDRTELSPDLDNFSAIFILVALRALAAQPNLWNDHVAHDQYDKLLIRKEDFKDPNQSDLYKTLQASPDTEVRQLSKDLFDLYRCPIDEVPRLQDVLFSYDQVRSLLSKNSFDEAVELLERQGPSRKDPPPDLVADIQKAYKRVDCREKLEAKVNAGDEAGMTQAYVPSLLDDYPRARSLVEIAKHASEVLNLIGQMQTAKQKQHWDRFVSVWDGHSQLLESRASPQVRALKDEVSDWRKRNQLCDQVLLLIGQPQPDHSQLSRVWSQLSQLRGHPKTDSKRPQIEGLIQRADAWDRFRNLDRTSSQQNDQQLLKHWREDAFAGWPVAEAERPSVEQAKQRLKAVEKLRSAAQQSAQPTQSGEQGICRQADGIPGGYTFAPDLQKRVQEARQRLKAHQQFQHALAAAQSEKDVATAGATLSGLGVRDWLDSTAQGRLQKAEQRAPLLDKLKAIPAGLPADEQDRMILTSWNEQVLKDCAEAQAWRTQYQDAARRKSLIDRLDAAVAAHEEHVVADLATDPLLNGYQLPSHLADAIQVIVQGVKGAQTLIAAIQSGDRDAFRAQFEADLMRRYRHLFKPFRTQVLQWIKEEILPARKLGLTPHILKSQGLKRDPSGVYHARWNWPHRRFTAECCIGVCRKKPTAKDIPKQIALPGSLNRITREQWDLSNGRREIRVRREWHNSLVVVWALIDVGFQSFASEPLILGRINLKGPN